MPKTISTLRYFLSSPAKALQKPGDHHFNFEMLTSLTTGLDEDAVRDREEHEDREDDKSDQSESEEEDDDQVYVDDSFPPVETPYIKNSTEELGQVSLVEFWLPRKLIHFCTK